MTRFVLFRHSSQHERQVFTLGMQNSIADIRYAMLLNLVDLTALLK
jgi:hypothetical protein